MSRALPRACATLILGCVATTASGAQPRLAASVQPIHSLVAAVADGIAAPRLLVPGGRSPHTFALAPSDTRALAHADAVFLAGGATEQFLERPLASLAADATAVRMTEAAGVHLRPSRSGGAWAHDDAGHGHDHGDAGADTPNHPDPHLWLDPRNAIAYTRAVADALARVDPDNATGYRRNAGAYVDRLERLDRELAAALGPVAHLPYLVFHDAYQYLEARYGLAGAGAITVDPGRPPGARRLGTLRQRIREQSIRCLFVEPQFEPGIAATIAEGTGARVATLDPLGAGLEPGPGLYPELMRALARDLRTCLLDGD